MRQNGSEWRPIETAPRDGTPVIVYAGEYGFKTAKGDIGIAIPMTFYDLGYEQAHEKWIAKDCCDGVTTYKPTYWMPLPDPPEDV